MKPQEWMTEAELQEAVANYLVREYPDVIFHSDFGSGTKLTPAQAKRQKRQNGYRKGWPDLEIAEPRFIIPRNVQEAQKYKECHWVVFPHQKGEFIRPALVAMCGLYIELKKDGTRLKKKNGEWATEHIAEQAKVLEKLRKCGYCAEFAVGFDEAKKIIDEYLGGKNGE